MSDNDIKNFFKRLQVDDKFCKLSGVTPNIREFKIPKLRQILNQLYKSDDFRWRWLATTINSIFTDKKGTFTFSRPILEQILVNDPKMKRKTVNSGEMTFFYDHRLSRLFERLREWSGSSPGVWTLTDPLLLALLQESVGKEFLEIQRQKVIAWQEEQVRKGFRKGNSNKTSSNSSNKTSTEQEREEEQDHTRNLIKRENTNSFNNKAGIDYRSQDYQEDVESWLVSLRGDGNEC